MQDLLFQSFDGLQVILEAQRWINHITKGHPEVTEQDVENTLGSPVRICDHKLLARRRIYEGVPRTTGFYRGGFPVVVVELTGESTARVITAYLDTLPYKGVQRWP